MSVVDKREMDFKSGRMSVIDEGVAKRPPGFGVRHQQCILLFFCLSVAYCLRVCMGVALVAMVESTPSHMAAQINDNETSHAINTEANNYTEDVEQWKSSGVWNSLLLVSPYPKFQWSKTIQDVIQSSFFWGYMTLQIPGSYVMQKFGAKYMLFGALCINGVLALCFPWAAFYGDWPLAVVFRIVMGLSQACFMPGMHMFFGRWAPLEERGRLTSYTYGGVAIGAVIGLPITGFIAASPLGWPGIFRFYGLLALLTAACLWWLGAETPAQHPRISVAERRYIEEGLGQSGDKKKPLSVPWKKILTHRGMLGIVFAHVGNTWGTLTVYTEIPAFMDKVMGVNIKANGLLSALPFFVMWLSSLLFSYITDMLIVKKILSVTYTRKLAQIVGTVVPVLGFIALGYVPLNIYIVESLLVLICTFKIASHSGFHVNHIDISPNFAGPMMSVSNFVSNSIGSLSPTVAGLILTDVTDVTLWRRVFLVTVGWYILTSTVYLIFGTGEIAEWNEPENNDKPEVALEEKPMIEKIEVEKQ